MADIRPFRGIRYNASQVELHRVVAPPYDVISPSLQEELYHQSPYNIVRLILGKEEDRYTSAANHFDAWQREAVLMRDPDPSVYILSQSFKDQRGRMVQRVGFIAALRLEEFSKGIVLPHEKTLSKPKEDRFKLMQATNANFSQIFGLFSDPEGTIDAVLKTAMVVEPVLEVTFEKVINRLWRIGDANVIADLKSRMKSRTVLIADGHHRYETALAYRDLQRLKNPGSTGEEPFNFVMMFLTNMDADGLVLYPTHRLVYGLPGFDPDGFFVELAKHFDIEPVNGHEQLVSTLHLKRQHAFGVVWKDGIGVVHLKAKAVLTDLLGDSMPAEVRELDVTLLHSYIIARLLRITPEAQMAKTNLEYVKEPAAVMQAVETDRAQMGFILNPTPIEQVRAVARTGNTMPQKSTYFYPKLLSGLVMNKLD
jgi:uncharacterized protein (DUF1015 family)